MIPKQAIEKLKDIPQNEFAYHLGLYETLQDRHFAVVKLSGSVIQNSLEEVVENLATLQQFGFNPVVTYGWGEELSTILKAQGISSGFQDGDRVTNHQIMQYVLQIANVNIQKLVTGLMHHGAYAIAFPHDKKIIAADQKEEMAHFGGTYNGTITSVNGKPLIDEAHRGLIPIVSPVGIDANGKPYNINAAEVGARLAEAVNAHKFLMVTGSKSVLDNSGQRIKEIILNRDYANLMNDGIISGGMKKNVDEAKYNLENRAGGIDLSAQVVGSGNLLKELFTFNGDGTLIRLGYSIEKTYITDKNAPVINGIVEDAFKSELRSDYFTDKPSKTASVFLEQGKKGVAICHDTPIGTYLDIFAVKNGYQGTGAGSDIMDSIKQTDGEKLFLRTKADRPVKDYYSRVFDGQQKFQIGDQTYIGFWRGMEFNEISGALQYMKQHPINLKT